MKEMTSEDEPKTSSIDVEIVEKHVSNDLEYYGVAAEDVVDFCHDLQEEAAREMFEYDDIYVFDDAFVVSGALKGFASWHATGGYDDKVVRVAHLLHEEIGQKKYGVNTKAANYWMVIERPMVRDDDVIEWIESQDNEFYHV